MRHVTDTNSMNNTIDTSNPTAFANIRIHKGSLPITNESKTLLGDLLSRVGKITNESKTLLGDLLSRVGKITVYPNEPLMFQSIPANVRINIRREDLPDILSKDPEETFGSDIVEMTLIDADSQPQTQPTCQSASQSDSPCQAENCDSPLNRIARLAEALCQGENGKDDSDPFATPLDEDTPLQQQIGGDHYKNCPIQPVEYCQHNGLNYCESNVVKYVTRHREKGGVEDLKKAKHYIDLLIAMEYGVDC